jgi:hypothetical protein
MVERAYRSMAGRPDPGYQLQVYLLDRGELLEYAGGAEIG